MVIFAAGVVTGGILSWRLQHSFSMPPPRPAYRAALPSSPGGLRLDFLRRAQRELDLTPQQRERIDKLLKESQERSRKIMEPLAPPLREELARAKQEFLQVLTPEQQKRFDDLVKKQPHPREPRRQPPDPSTNRL